MSHKMIMFFAGCRRGKDCDPRAAVERELDVMTTYWVQKTKRKKNRLMAKMIRERKRYKKGTHES